MDWDDAWQSFVSKVESEGNNDNVCKIAGSLSNVQVDADGAYHFHATSRQSCAIVQAVLELAVRWQKYTQYDVE